MKTYLSVILGKAVSYFLKKFNLGSGSTWPGEIALKLSPQILSKIAPKNVILVAGTNGKTTTALMIKTMLENGGHNVIHNASGANLLNGVVSSILTSLPREYGVFEVDENTLPIVLKYVKPKIIILLNLFRDQLDRYGEVDTIAKNWLKALKPQDCQFIINADDPYLVWIGKNLKNVSFFGLGDKKYFLPQVQHATDSIYCPKCGTRLNFSGHYFSHLGQYSCPKCHFSHPHNDLWSVKINSPLEGVYNLYNVLAATLVSKKLSISPNLSGFSPAFGRQEEIGDTKILLSKNPAGFNESIRTVLNSKKKGPLLLVLNDRIPDGRDVSWIWDVDFEALTNYGGPITVSGDRVYDLALRLKYAEITDIRIEPDLTKAVLNQSWILTTYSAMLRVRKILTGKRIP